MPPSALACWSRLIHAVACIRYKADQVVVGTAINILMIGLPGFLSGAFFLSSGSTPQIPIEQLIPRAPIVMAFAFVPLAWYVLYRTPFGLRLRAVGENPEAADAAGISVAKMQIQRRAAVGRAGRDRRRISLDRTVVALHAQHDLGRGFIALAALIFGKVAAGADAARLPVLRPHRGDDHPDAGRC